MSAQGVLWIDGVGGYAMCDGVSTVLGGAGATSEESLRLMGDLPSRSVVFLHRGQDHLIDPLQPIELNGRKIETRTLLSDGDSLLLGRSIVLSFAQPTQLSGTGRLTIQSGHRWHGSIDGVLLLGNSCLLGPSPTAHVRCRHWEKDIILFRHQDQWLVRRDEYLDDGSVRPASTSRVKRGERIQGQGFSMTWL